MTKRKKYLMIIGAITGLVNGLLGGGGGMIIVPMFTNILKYEEKQAHATAVAVILPISVISGIIYICGGCFKVYSGLNVLLGVVIGGVVGCSLLTKLKKDVIQKIFIVVVILSGLKMVFL